MLVGLLHVWDFSGSNMQGAWMCRRVYIRVFFSMAQGGFLA